MKIYTSMVLPTPKQMIKLLQENDGIALGVTPKAEVKGLSNEFFTQKILDKVGEDIPQLHYAFKNINNQRTLWLITSKHLDVFNSIKAIN